MKVALAFTLVLASSYLVAQSNSEITNEAWRTTIDSFRNSGSGFSGPGTIAKRIKERGRGDGPHWGLENGPTDKYGEVVKKGLLPDIKPLLDIHIRDAVVILGGDGYYYMTGSTGNNVFYYNEGIELYRSANLKKWEYLGVIWNIDREGGWEKNAWEEKPWSDGKPVRAVWAPELHYIKGNYYICLSMSSAQMSILKSTTGQPEGPYKHTHDPQSPLPVKGIDPSLFEDENGSVYFIYGSARQIAKMNDDLSGFSEPFRALTLLDPVVDSTLHNVKFCKHLFGYKDIGYEGPTIFKRNNKYYLGVTDRYEGRYSLCVAMADQLYGPYQMRHESVACNGGTNFFKGKDGHWYSSFFGDDRQAPFRSMPGIVRIDFASDGKVMVAKKQPKFVLRK